MKDLRADQEIIKKVYAFAKNKKKILVVLDSFHTHDHVTKELELYSPLVSEGSYLLVFDTIIEDMPDDSFPGSSPGEKGTTQKLLSGNF